jgi:hypothetical protein
MPMTIEGRDRHAGLRPHRRDPQRVFGGFSAKALQERIIDPARWRSSRPTSIARRQGTAGSRPIVDDGIALAAASRSRRAGLPAHGDALQYGGGP